MASICPAASLSAKPARTESRYYRLEFVKLDLDDGEIGIAAGFRDVDGIVRREMVTQKQLREAVEAANTANRAKSNFLSSMSHEMRTPLNAIIGLDTLLLKNPDLPQGARDQAEKIDISAHHLLELINNILDMNRIDEHLSKPVDVDLLFKSLRWHIANRDEAG